MFVMFKISGEASCGTHPRNPNPPEAEAESSKLEAILGYNGGTPSEATVGKIQRFHFINAQENENSHEGDRHDVQAKD